MRSFGLWKHSFNNLYRQY